MIPEARRAGIRIDRDRRPLSRGVRYLVTFPDGRTAVAWGRAELRAVLSGAPVSINAAPGARAAICRPARRYL